MVFHLSLCDNKSSQVSRTRLSILADLSNAVVRIVFTPPLISKSFSLCMNPLVTVSRAQLYLVQMSLSWSTVFSIPFLFAFFQLYLVVSRNSKVHNSTSSLFFVDYYKVRSLAEIIIIVIIIIYSFRVFHISVSWWFFTGVWVTASVLRSPGLVSGFWPFLAMLSFG